MRRALLELLEQPEVLGAVSATLDGLVIAVVGLADEDAERVAAAGCAFARSLRAAGKTQGCLALAGGWLVLALRDELMLIALTETAPATPLLGERMDATLARLAARLRTDPLVG